MRNAWLDEGMDAAETLRPHEGQTWTRP